MSRADDHRDPATERLLARYVAAPFDVAMIGPGAIDWDRSTRWQIRSAGTDPVVVDRYVDAIETSEILPAGIGIDHRPIGLVEIVAGQHRGDAWRRLDQAVPLYLLDPDVDEELVRRLAIEDNTRHGQPLSSADRQRLGLALVDDGLDQAQAARIVGLSSSTLSHARHTVEGTARADRNGIGSPWASLAPTTQSRLQRFTADRSDDVFAEAVYTTRACKLTAPQIDDLGRRLANAGDDDAALDAIAAFEAEHHPGSSTGQRAARPNVAGAARSFAAQLLDLDVDDVLATVTDDQATSTAELLTRAARRLDQIAAAIAR